MNPETISKSADLISSAVSETAAAASNGAAIPYMSPEMIAAAIGALIGGGIIILFEVIKQYRANSALRKALKIGLYFEVSDNFINELPLEADGSPNFELNLFYDSFYRQNKTDIVRLLDEKLLIRLSRFYTMASYAHNLKETVSEKATKINAPSVFSNADATARIKNSQLHTLQQGLKRDLRFPLCAALGSQEVLKPELESVFASNPLDFQLHPPTRYEKWWNKYTKEQKEAAKATQPTN